MHAGQMDLRSPIFAWRQLNGHADPPSIPIFDEIRAIAIAVLCGIVIAALNFAWQHARETRADVKNSGEGVRTYVLHGTLFFASTANFQDLFEP
jgi:sulfate permease, SulP family